MLGALAASALPIGSPQPVSAAPDPAFVQRDGTQLTVDGDPFYFSGFNIYNANSNGWCRTAYSDELLGQALDEIDGGHAAIRSWFFQTLAAPNASGEHNWSRFDRLLTMAAERGIRVIVTLTDQWGECGVTISGHTGYKTADWYQNGYLLPEPLFADHYGPAWLSYRDWVAAVVNRYKDNPSILAWQLINEAEVKTAAGDSACAPGARDILKSWARDVSGVVDAIDSNHLISLGTIGSGQCGTADTDYTFVHDIPQIDLCEFHDYSTAVMPGDEWNGLQRRIDQCDALNKPLIVGEVGLSRTLGLEERAQLMSQKLTAQQAAGVDGHLVWQFAQEDAFPEQFDVRLGANDPMVTAVRAVRDATLPPDPETFTATWTVTKPSGEQRTDGTIMTGDSLAVSYAASDGTAFTRCVVRVTGYGGMMQSDGALNDGRCGFQTIIPRNQMPIDDSADNDLCVWLPAVNFADAQPRTLAASQWDQPSGRHCNNWNARQGDVLSFRWVDGGVPQPFASNPQWLSWHLPDWDPEFTPLRFNTPWNLRFPSWVAECDAFLNGSWSTSYRVIYPETGCPDWTLRLPGILPATMPWTGGPGDWQMSFVISYESSDGSTGHTQAMQDVPFEPSDGIFESSLPAIAPVDLARARFATVGERWQPTFQVTDPEALDCELWQPGSPDVRLGTAPVDAQGICTFDIEPFTSAVQSQYSVQYTRATPGGTAVYGGRYWAIEPSAPPPIDPPTTEPDGTTVVAAGSDDESGMAIEVVVEPAPADAPPVTSIDRKASTTTTSTAACGDVSYTPNPETGGAVPDAVARCELAEGEYIVTARLVNAAGDVSISTRRILAPCSAVAPFSDVGVDNPFCPEIKWVKDRGISTGYEDGTYRPSAVVTRQAMSAFLARLAEATLTTCTSDPFSDVPTTHPYCREITWMKEAAISTGFNDGTYRPSATVTRQAMSAFMARLAGVALTPCTTAPFTDVSSSHPFCKEIAWMKEAGISNGFSDGTYRPDAVVTRQAMSAFMFRVASLL